MTDRFLKWLNEKDKTQIKRKKFNKKIDEDTHKYQKQYGFDINIGDEATHNNEADAFKHAYMQAVLYQMASKIAPLGKDSIGELASKIVGDYHEREVINPPENNMDYWNNEVGREIAKDVRKKLGKSADTLPDEYIENMFAKEIVEKMKKGELITTPEDKRKFEDRAKYKHTIRNAQKSNINKFKGEYNNTKKGRWVTMNGNHIFIED